MRVNPLKKEEPSSSSNSNSNENSVEPLADAADSDASSFISDSFDDQMSVVSIK